MAIQPIDLPSAAGLEYGRGDVRHFAQGDAVDVPGIANPTRHLAERDNQVAVKLNEVIEVVNNREQFVPLPLIRTVLPPSDEAIVTNYRIPAGFESRILDAAISSTPVSANIVLEIHYNTTYGGATGTEVVSTSSEFTGGIDFYQEGEFIVILKNTGGTTLEVAASVLLTLRPTGGEGGLLVASVVQGAQGVPGPTGPPGPGGPPGTGGAGSPGMVWRGPWTANSSGYQARDTVSHAFSGSMTAAYFCLVSHAPSNAGNEPPNATFWDLVVAPSVGAAGPTGNSTASFTSQFSSGTLFTAANYLPGSFNAVYTAGVVLTAGTTYGVPFSEVAVTNAGTGGVSFITMTHRTCFAGEGTYWFPQSFNGALTNYALPFINTSAVSQGTVPVEVSMGTYGGVYSGPLIQSRAHPEQTAVIVEVTGTIPQPVQIQIFGAQQFSTVV